MQWRQKKIAGLAVLFVFWIGLNYFTLHSPPVFFQPPNVEAIDQVEFAFSEATSPSALNDVRWSPQTLPDSWHKNHSGSKQIWYRSKLSYEPSSDALLGIYIPSVTHNAAVYINGVWVGHGGPINAPISRHHKEPLLFSFSPQLLRAGENHIDIRVATTFHNQGFLSKIYFAPVTQLAEAYQLKYFVRVELIRWVTIALFLMGCITFSFWLVRPQDSIYLVLSMVMVIWGIHNLNLFVSEIPFSTPIWEALIMGTLGWAIILVVLFIQRYTGDRNKTVESLLFILAFLGVGIFFLPSLEAILKIGYLFWDASLIVIGLYAEYLLFKKYWRTQKADIYFMLFLGAMMLVFGLHDILLVNHQIDRQEGLIIQYAILPTLLFFSWLIMHRFVSSVSKAEFLAATLERRVKVKKEALQLQYEKVKVMEQQQVLAQERERMMRDMHDGIGGHLVSLITQLQEHKGNAFKRIREKAERSLTDLRCVIDSLDPVQYELPTLLGTMRMRLQDQLDAEKIELEWAVTDLPDVPGMTPHHCLHIMRIVQEAFTNSIKHAQCQTMKLVTGVVEPSGSHAYIDIIDYGKGFDLAINDDSKEGRGVKNMYHRAEQIGAQLQIASSDTGTRVRLLIALHP